MKKWKNIKIQEQLMKDIEKVKNEKHFKSKSKFLEDAVNEKLKRIREEDTKDRLADIQEFLEKNSITLRRKGINNMLELTSTTLSNSEDIKKLEKKLEHFIKEEEEDKEIARDAEQFRKDNPMLEKDIDEYMDKEMADMKKHVMKMYKRSGKSS